MSSWVNKVVGLPLLLAGVALLVWNENHYVHATRLLSEAAKALTPLSDTLNIDPANEGRLVFYDAQVQCGEPVFDPLYGAGGAFAAVQRDVEYYQWIETQEREPYHDSEGNKQYRTRYRYSTAWSQKIIDTESFNTREGRQLSNAPLTRIASEKCYSPHTRLGPYELCHDLIDSIPESEPGVHALDPASKVFLSAADSTTRDGSVPLYVRGDTLYYGSLPDLDIEHAPNAGHVGDVRVIFRYRRPCHAWVLAQPQGHQLKPFQASDHYWLTFARFSQRRFDPDEAIGFEQWGFNTLVWTLRVIGWLMIVGGLKQLMRMLLGFLKKIPIIGVAVTWGIAAVAWVAGTVLAVLVIAATFLFLRPWLGIGLLAGIGALWAAAAWWQRSHRPVPPPLPVE